MGREPFDGSAWGERAGAHRHEPGPPGPPRAPGPRRPPRLRPAAVAAVVIGLGSVAAIASGAVPGDGVDPVHRGHLSGAVAELRESHRAGIRRMTRPPRVLGVKRAKLEQIAECESHGDPRAVSSDGTYRGKYQFDRGTWRSNGGSGDPAKAPEPEQDLRAAALYRAAGSNPWPNCG